MGKNAQQKLKPGPKPKEIGTNIPWQDVIRKAVNTPRPKDWDAKKKN
ncbi:MAG: hypothetical protein IMZ62_09835 [Chloroflexi bacterium]|nr:hypothetical protein [Chloroflexota bacterium]